MFLIELLIPFFIFVPRRLRILRIVTFDTLMSFQLLIEITGNYAFFNLLTIVLRVSLLDDSLLSRLMSEPERLSRTAAARSALTPKPIFKGVILVLLAAVFLPTSCFKFFREIVRTVPNPRASPSLPEWMNYLTGWTAPFLSMNAYGLFRVMTTERPTFVIEGSRDGVVWKKYQFRWKPSDMTQRPRFVAPHQPRLDWQMWFAVLNRADNQR